MVVSSWKGWSSPETDAGWVDLTRGFDSDVERVASFPPPTIERYFSMPTDPLNVTRLDTIVHVGTHLDAPSHFIPDGPAMHEIPAARLHGPGVVWRLPDLGPFDTIQVDMLADMPDVEPGDMLVLSTGWAAHWGSPVYHQHPSLSVNTAQWLVDRGIGAVLFDLPTPDLALALRPPDFDWPVHQVLLRNGVLIVEHLCAPGTLGERVEIFIGAIKLIDADGAPARVLGRTLV